MVSPSTDQRQTWLSLPPFSLLSHAATSRLEASSQPLRFAEGQAMSSDEAIGAQILVVLEGEARLLGQRGGRPFTLQKLGPGEIVGLASLLRAAACERVNAATPLVAMAIPDGVMLELLRQEAPFRDWCATHLWLAELHGLLVSLEDQNPAAEAFEPNRWRQHLAQLAERARLLPPQQQPLNQLAAGEVAYLASANVPGLGMGNSLRRGEALPKPLPPLPLRLIALPEAHTLTAPGEEPPAALAASDHFAGGALPEPTGLDLGQPDHQRGFTLVRASGTVGETSACLQMIARLLKLPFRRDAVEKILREKIDQGQRPTLQLCGQIAAMLGLLVSGARVGTTGLTRIMTPALLPWNDGFAILVSCNAQGWTLASPREGWVRLSPAQIKTAYPEGLELLLLERSTATPEQRFGPGWFWPALKRYRGMLLQVLLASFVVQLFSLANPLLIQVIIDKVIAQRSLDTLQILGMALVVVTLMEGVIGSLRTFLFTDTTNRIDLRLGAEVIDHLLRLPLNYFDRRPVGELGTRVAELEKIRNFLTGQALITILDGAFSVIYIIVMVIYSWVLTLIALAVLPIQIAITLLGAPLFRRQYRQAAEENARTQSHLVEVISGIQTVKAQNVEMVSRWKWQDFYAKYISRTFDKTITGTFLNETSQVLQKLSQLLVLWVGASMVLKSELTLGQLIAFRIIS
ncbi:MAG: ABC transporter transmembrane domain-containing protein, partial [Cyanobacteriota bacterium]|nr:ABC transporter transmembrane domain-containing protein [Cyanobacteriota bacterium]